MGFLFVPLLLLFASVLHFKRDFFEQHMKAHDWPLYTTQLAIKHTYFYKHKQFCLVFLFVLDNSYFFYFENCLISSV
jgi:hypothetical protein